MKGLDALKSSRVAASGTLSDAMRVLETGAAGIALVINDDGVLVGTLTDGDVRRALLGGAGLEAGLVDHMQRHFTAVGPSAGRGEVLDLMQARTIGQIPIVDGQGRLLGLHLLRQILGTAERPNWAVVMAGGRGARLRPLTDNVPKPMLRVAGRPILERIVLQLVGHGLRRIFLSINYLGEQVEAHFGDGKDFGCRIEYLRESEPLGTGGSLSLLPARPDAPFVVMNGDLVTQADIGAMLAFHESGDHRATVGVRRYFHTIPFGCVEMEGERVVALEEKPRIARQVNAGIYVLDPGLLDRVPSGREFALPSLLRDCLERGEAVRAFEIVGDWIDAGQGDQLTRAREGDS
jgi:dTDP-glucose pyrophosphorylase